MKNSGFPPLTRCASNFPPLVSHTRSSISHQPLEDDELSSKSRHPLVDDELSICEILSRLPVESLMRFKLVCKHWQSLVQKDDHFIDLHHTRSQTRKSLLIRSPTYGERYYLLADLVLGEGSGGATVHRKIPDMGPNVSLQPLNGLFCFIDCQEASVCIQNPSTRESTPWIKSVIKQQHEDEGKIIEVIDGNGDLVKYNVEYRNYYRKFGFDPATKEHKVISLWIKRLSNRRLGRSEDWLCEVLTVRQNSWRTIDAIPPISPIRLSSSQCAYVNGSIYWLYYGPRDDPSIVEFNVGNEMFRVTPLPKFIMNDIRVPYDDGNSITEVDGHLVLLAKKIRMSGDAFFTDWIKNNESSMKMCILYNDDQRKSDTGYGGSSTCSDVGDNSNYYWMEDSFLMPPFDWKQEDNDSILPIPGTDLMIVKSSDACSFYYYNWKKKSFSNKLRINGLNLFMNEKASKKPIMELKCWIFEESLLRVN